jgi:hypothetical protein
MEAATEGFEPLLVYLRDIQKYLDNNLTTDGVAGIVDLMAKAAADGNMVIRQMDSALQASDEATALIMPPKAPAETE